MGVNPHDFLPGRTDIKQEQINTTPPIYTSGPTLNDMEQRWHTTLAGAPYMSPEMKQLLYVDMTKLIAVAKAAHSLKTSTNAESYRQALANLMNVCP